MGWIAPLLALTLASTGEPADFDPFVTAVPIEVQDFGSQCDLDYDGLPDGWTRRSGRHFPHYIDVRIDRRVGHDAPGSLQFKSNGAAAVLYSKPLRIDAGHVHVFEAFLRTRRLKGDAALCSVSVLDERMNRISRHLTVPVSGTHSDWVQVRVGPIAPVPGQRFIVIGCHLVCSDQLDLEGVALFDDIRVGRNPFLSFNASERRFLRTSQATELGVGIAGIAPGTAYELILRLYDVHGEVIDKTSHRIVAPPPMRQNDVEPLTIPWPIAGLNCGFYRLDAQLVHEGRTTAKCEASFVVTDPVEPIVASPFGWSLASLPKHINAEDFARVAKEAGLGHVKIPLWRDATDRDQLNRSAEFIDQLSARQIDVVGVLDPPPDDLRRMFATDWSGVGEIYQLAAPLWKPSLAPVVAQYGAKVRDWQLGGDDDQSFEEFTDLPGLHDLVRQSFARVGRNSRIGVPWTNQRPLDDQLTGFVSIPDDLAQPLVSEPSEKLEIWTSIRPLPKRGHDPHMRAFDLVRRLVTARSWGAKRVSLATAQDSDGGLIGEDGSPTELLLPWRTTALALRDLHDLGSMNLRQGSDNRAFGNGSLATVVLWSEKTVSETIVVGGSPVATDVWGRQTPLPIDEDSGQVTVDVGPSPVFLTGLSPALLRWQIEAGFDGSHLRSQHGQQPLAIVGRNPFEQGVSGTVTLVAPKGWNLETSQWQLRLAAGEAFRLPAIVSLPADTSLGNHPLKLEFRIQADRRYSFIVQREIIVGLGDVEIEVTDRLLPDGRLEVVQSITNHNEPPEVLNFRCDLFVPGEQRKRHYVVKLGQGRDIKRYYVSDGSAMIGQELRVRAEQENGRRVLNYRWIAGKN